MSTVSHPRGSPDTPQPNTTTGPAGRYPTTRPALGGPCAHPMCSPDLLSLSPALLVPFRKLGWVCQWHMGQGGDTDITQLTRPQMDPQVQLLIAATRPPAPVQVRDTDAAPHPTQQGCGRPAWALGPCRVGRTWPWAHQPGPPGARGLGAEPHTLSPGAWAALFRAASFMGPVQSRSKFAERWI